MGDFADDYNGVNDFSQDPDSNIEENPNNRNCYDEEEISGPPDWWDTHDPMDENETEY